MKLERKGATLLEAITQIQLLLIIGIVYFAWCWWLVNAKPSLIEIQKEVQANSQRIERIEALIKSKMKDPEQWQKANDLMKAD